MTQEIQPHAESPLDIQIRKAKLLCDSQFVPANYRGRPEDLLVAIQLAERINIDPMAVLAGTFVIKGKVGMSTAFMLSLERKAGIFDAPIYYESYGSGKDLSVTAVGEIGGKRYDATVSMAMAKAEGWTSNKKYDTLPEHMLRLRSAAFLIRLTCPEVLIGMQTSEELTDMGYAEPARITESARETLSSKMRGSTEVLPTPCTTLTDGAVKPDSEDVDETDFVDSQPSQDPAEWQTTEEETNVDF